MVMENLAQLPGFPRSAQPLQQPMALKAFNKLGWYGITKGGEGYDYDPQLIKLLQARSNAVFCLFDNDKTGNASMEKHTLKHGLQGIDLATYINDKAHTLSCEFDQNGINLTVNDVCDFIDFFDAQSLEKLIKVEIRTKKAESILPYRPTFSNVSVTKFDAYLCDNPIEYGLFKNYIHTVRKLIFSALTGTGKTTVFLKRIANDTAFLAENGIERIVYLTPTNSIGKQQELEHKIPFITSLHKENSDEINQSKRRRLQSRPHRRAS